MLDCIIGKHNTSLVGKGLLLAHKKGLLLAPLYAPAVYTPVVKYHCWRVVKGASDNIHIAGA